MNKKLKNIFNTKEVLKVIPIKAKGPVSQTSLHSHTTLNSCKSVALLL